MRVEVEKNVVHTDLSYQCGRTDRYEGYVPVLAAPFCPDCGSPAFNAEREVEREVERAPGVDVTGTGIKDGIVLEEGSLEQASVAVVLADILPQKVEALQKLVGTGGLTRYEMDVIAKGLALVKADALTRIARAN